MRLGITLLLRLGFGLLGASIGAASAQAGASAWIDAADGGRMRLISAGGLPEADGSVLAGIEIDLDQGWKTYWRHPGGAGLAPLFDLSASDNIASVEIDFPVPQRFDEGGTTLYGYKERVVFPIRIQPEDGTRPVRLALSADYGLCSTLCIPATAALELELPVFGPRDGRAARLVREARSQVPVMLADDAQPVLSVERLATGEVAVIVDGAASRDIRDLFLEAENPAEVGATHRSADGQRYVARITGFDAEEGATLKATLINAEGNALERVLHLEGGGDQPRSH